MISSNALNRKVCLDFKRAIAELEDIGHSSPLFNHWDRLLFDIR